VLGFNFDCAGNLMAAAANGDPPAISPDGRITFLACQVGGDPIRHADAGVVANAGKVNLTDAAGSSSPAHRGGTCLTRVDFVP
jgi:hypothetical protein